MPNPPENPDRPFLVALLGSPRSQGNTGVLLDRVLAGAEEEGARVERVELRLLSYRSCRHCRGCEGNGLCVVGDDMQRLYELIRAAQYLVLASPIHFSGVSGELKLLIDRGQALWVERYLLKQAPPVADRRGVFIATCGGSDARVFSWAKHTVLAFLNSAGFAYWGEIFEAATDRPPPMAERAGLLSRAQEVGRALVRGADPSASGP